MAIRCYWDFAPIIVRGPFIRYFGLATNDTDMLVCTRLFIRALFRYPLLSEIHTAISTWAFIVYQEYRFADLLLLGFLDNSPDNFVFSYVGNAASAI